VGRAVEHVACGRHASAAQRGVARDEAGGHEAVALQAGGDDVGVDLREPSGVRV
jgi:hypothetical protein